MPEKITHNRRRFLGNAAMTLAGTQFDLSMSAEPAAYAKMFSGKYSHGTSMAALDTICHRRLA
jgi:hypothetical protein